MELHTLNIGRLQNIHMLRVSLINTPLRDGNSTRGVGEYTRRLTSMIEYQNKDIEITHYPFFDLFKHTLPIFKKTKTVVTIHDVIPLEYPQIYKPGIKGWINLQLQKLALSGVERVITDSYASVLAIKKYLGVPDSKIKLVYLAAGDEFKPKKVTKKYGLPKKFVLFIGDVNWNKNIPGLIAACKKINTPLVIIGRQAKEIETLDLNHPELKHLKNLDLNRVIRLGYVSDDEKIDILNLASVYCQPSFAEGFGVPVIEAMACGVQVAVSNTHSLPEIAGNAATYFDPHNIEAMAKAIVIAMNSKYDVISQSKKFSWKKTLEETQMVYNRLCQ